MKEYPFFQDEKITMWQRHCFSVTAESQEEAERIICQSRLGHESVDQVADGQQIIFKRTEDLLDTRSQMHVSQNGGSDTLAVLSLGQQKRVICTNADKPEADDVPEIPAAHAEVPPLLCSSCGTVINGPFYNPPCGPFCFACWEKKPQKERDRALADALRGLAALGKTIK